MNIVLYSRRGCHLCHEAADALETLGIVASVIDIDGDAGLVAAYGTRIPVVTVDGVVIAEGRVDPVAVRCHLASGGAPPGGHTPADRLRP